MGRRPHTDALLGILACLGAVAAGSRSAAQDSRPATPAVWLGAETGRADADSTRLVITVVEPGSPAAAAGLEPADVIVRVDGITMSAPDEFSGYVQGRRAGDRMRVAVLRPDGSESTLLVTLASPAASPTPAMNSAPAARAPAPSAAAAWRQGRPRLGIEVMELDAELAAYLHAPRGAVVLVTRVQDAVPGQNNPLRTGDVILQVDGHDVLGAADVSTILDARQDGEHVEVVVWRKDERKTLRAAVESRGAWFGRTRGAATSDAGNNEQLQREIQKLRRDVEDLRREVDILRRGR